MWENINSDFKALMCCAEELKLFAEWLATNIPSGLIRYVLANN